MVCLVMALSLFVQQDPKEREIEAKLKNLKLTLDFKDATLDQIADYLRDVADINLIVSGKVEKVEGISIKVTDLSLRSVLSLILAPRNLITIVKDGVLTIATREEEPVVLDIYDVKDLTYVLPDFPGVEKGLEGSPFDPPSEPTEAPPLPIEELVKGHTGGKSWDEGRATIALHNGLLVVKQTKAVHQQIRRMLNELRRMR
jgi:hypothetical protein